jgi:hypothetical protein
MYKKSVSVSATWILFQSVFWIPDLAPVCFGFGNQYRRPIFGLGIGVGTDYWLSLSLELFHLVGVDITYSLYNNLQIILISQSAIFLICEANHLFLSSFFT